MPAIALLGKDRETKYNLRYTQTTKEMDEYEF